jgi:peptide/nickel transport system ATP-binding protein
LINNNLLEVQGLSVVRTDLQHQRDGLLLLDNIDLTIAPGETVGVVGGSGAGKSTLGRALLGHARRGTAIVQGRIVFEQRDILKMSAADLRRVRGGGIAYVAQNPASSFNPALTLGAQIVEVLKTLRGLAPAEARAQAIELLASLHLPDPEAFLGRHVHQVSGGQLQRAMIAMALASSPSLIVFDEPTTALDPHTRSAVVALIFKVLKEHGTAAVYISHDLNIVRQVADRVVRLEQGVLLKPDQVAALLHRVAEARPCEDAVATNLRKAEALPILKAQNLSGGFQSAHGVLKNVSFSVQRGSILGVVGRSGSGKSTLARVICGLHPTYQGQVCLQGVHLPADIAQRTFEQARQIQMVYQSAETAINPEHTVERVLGRVVRRLQGLSAAQARTEVVALLEMVGLHSGLLKRKTREMSGGQIQRIGIARALAGKPELIVLDEVTSALDIDTAADILALLRTLQRQEGLTYLFISHDMAAIRTLCDNVAVIADGEIVETGPTDDVLSTPEHVHTRELFATHTAVA